jgi:hypothetical protein
LTRKTWDQPATIGKYRSADTAKPTQRGVIYAVAPSPLDINRIWAGTDDGLIHVTADGGATWNDVTPPDLKPWMKVSIMDAGHFDVQTAYAAINTLRLDDLRPHIYRTHDGGRTWTHIANGIPDGAPVDAVHGDDLIAGTQGRGIWILDDITPLRQVVSLQPSAISPVLFKPQVAYRVRQNTNTDTPIPPDEAGGVNPPDGAIINYTLALAATGPVTLEIFSGSPGSAAGERLVRRYSSTDPVETPDPATAPVPVYWYRPARALPATAGMHRFMWDLHYQPLRGGSGGRGGLPIAAVPHDTPPAPTSPWAAPGPYTVRLTVDGKSYTQPLTLKMDPRVTTPTLGLAQQFTLSKQLYDGVLAVQKAQEEIRALRDRLSSRRASLSGEPSRSAESLALQTLGQQLSALEGQAGGGFGGGRGAAPEGPETFASITGTLNQLMGLLQGADVTPTTQLVSAVAERRAALNKLLAQWTALKAEARTLSLAP